MAPRSLSLDGGAGSQADAPTLLCWASMALARSFGTTCQMLAMVASQAWRKPVPLGPGEKVVLTPTPILDPEPAPAPAPVNGELIHINGIN